MLEDAGVAAGDIDVLTADAAAPENVATVQNLQERIGRLGAGPEPAGCFLFVTSHGVRDQGLALSADQAVLPPDLLGQLLDRTCGARPTVVIASGCYSGLYADEPALNGPHRIVMTASRPDRPSFGCSVGEQFTYYDYCLLSSLQRGLPWSEVAGAAADCVAAREAEAGFVPSEPQLRLGREVRALKAFAD